MTEVTRHNIRLARQGDYDIIADTLGCIKSPVEMRCRKHNAVWIHDRCMVANAVANRIGSKILSLEQRITALLNRPTGHDMMAAKSKGYEEGFDAGLQKAINLVGQYASARASLILKRYLKDRVSKKKSES